MPYFIRKMSTGKFGLIRKDGTVKSTHETKKKAKAAERLLMGLEHGMKLKK